MSNNNNQAAKKVFLLLTSNSSSLFIIHSFASHFFRIKKTTQKRPFEWRLKSEWGIKEKEGAAQHHREREACSHAQESRINHFIFAMIIIIIIAMFMTMQRENEKSSIVYDAKGINFSLELHCEPLLWHVINMSTCITIHPSKVITLFASCTMMRCIFLGFFTILLLLPFSAWRETI